MTLRPQTLRVLDALVAAEGDLVTKESLMDRVWADAHVTDDSLVQCISEIRRALGEANGRLLRTVPKQGYRLDCVATPEAPAPRRSVLAMAAAVLVVAAVVAAGFWLLRPGDPGPAPGVTIAVMPFENMSADPEQDYMTVGLAEDLRIDLARVGGLTVLARSAMDAAGVLAPAHGATHVVDGSLQRDGERLRISVSLVDAESGASLWAERYDRTLGDIFAVQDDVRSRILSALKVQLVPGANALVAESRTTKAGAYDLLLQGRYYEAALTRPGVTRAAELYTRALAIDPAYAEAHARLANMYDFMARFHWTDNTEAAREKALAEAATAVSIAPRSPFAHWTLGRITARLDPGPDAPERAAAALRSAIELDPNYADAYGFLALVLIGDGQPEEAREAIDRAYLLNAEPPSWYAQNRGIIDYFAGDIDAAIADFEAAAEKNTTAAYAHFWLAAAYASAGRVDDAEWEVAEGIAYDGPPTASEVVSSNTVFRYEPYKKAYEEGLVAAGMPR